MERKLLFYMFVFIVCLHYGCFVASLPSSESLKPRNALPNDDINVGGKSGQKVGHLIKKRGKLFNQSLS